MDTEVFDAIIVGAGQAGPAIAARCSREGLKTAVIERNHFGGTCVNIGCVPSKTLIRAAETLHNARVAARFAGIAAEAEAIVEGKLDPENNPLKRAPHTVEDLVGEWDRPYSRESACYPAGAFRVDKYWSPVNRVDNVFGDRNLICSCPPLESYAEAAE